MLVVTPGVICAVLLVAGVTCSGVMAVIWHLVSRRRGYSADQGSAYHTVCIDDDDLEAFLDRPFQ